MAKGLRLDIRLADLEMEMLKGMALERGLTLSAFVRSVLFEGAARVADGAVEVPKVVTAREVPLPPVKARRKTAAQSIATLEALNPISHAVQAFAEKVGPAMLEDAAEMLDLPDDAPITLPGPDAVSVGRDGHNVVTFSKPIPPDFDVLEDLPPLEPSDAEFEALLPTPTEMAVIMGERSLKISRQ